MHVGVDWVSVQKYFARNWMKDPGLYTTHVQQPPLHRGRDKNQFINNILYLELCKMSRTVQKSCLSTLYPMGWGMIGVNFKQNLFFARIEWHVQIYIEIHFCKPPPLMGVQVGMEEVNSKQNFCEELNECPDFYRKHICQPANSWMWSGSQY